MLNSETVLEFEMNYKLENRILHKFTSIELENKYESRQTDPKCYQMIENLHNNNKTKYECEEIISLLCILYYTSKEEDIIKYFDETVCKMIVQLLDKTDNIEQIRSLFNLIYDLDQYDNYVMYFSDYCAIEVILKKYRMNTSCLFLYTSRVLSSMLKDNCLQNIAYIMDNFFPSIINYCYNHSDQQSQEVSLIFIYSCINDVNYLSCCYINQILEVLSFFWHDKTIDSHLFVLSLWCFYTIFEAYPSLFIQQKFMNLIDFMIDKLMSKWSNIDDDERMDPRTIIICCLSLFLKDNNPNLSYILEKLPYNYMLDMLKKQYEYLKYYLCYLFSCILKLDNNELKLILIKDYNLLNVMNFIIDDCSYRVKLKLINCFWKLILSNSPEVIFYTMNNNIFINVISYMIESSTEEKQKEHISQKLKYAFNILQNSPDLFQKTISNLQNIKNTYFYNSIEIFKEIFKCN